MMGITGHNAVSLSLAVCIAVSAVKGEIPLHIRTQLEPPHPTPPPPTCAMKQAAYMNTTTYSSSN
jgi:hypothetical protein